MPAAESNGNLVAAGGKVTYTITLTTGQKVLPIGNNQLHLEFGRTRTAVTVVDNKCTTANHGDFDVGQVPNKEVPANTDLTCKLEVQPNSIDQDGASIPSFIVNATFTGDNTTYNEYYVPPKSTPTVPVHTGAVIESISSAVINADGTTGTSDGTWFAGDLKCSTTNFHDEPTAILYAFEHLESTRHQC